MDFLTLTFFLANALGLLYVIAAPALAFATFCYLLGGRLDDR
jgi:hypothetical protein